MNGYKKLSIVLPLVFCPKSPQNIRQPFILLVLEIQRFKSLKACRPKARQAKVNANSSTNSLKNMLTIQKTIKTTCEG
ncbi:MAG: hypothetical protein LBP59_14740 [Planctomycetaceae bacterium]|nr:hypothetical protein [Planctomycetaceae bacterium]